MTAVQLDLFDDAEPAMAPPLNGMYHEAATDKFVSFVQGRRHYEIAAKGCGFLREWQERIRKERSI
jgi:hypothetical protein